MRISLVSKVNKSLIQPVYNKDSMAKLSDENREKKQDNQNKNNSDRIFKLKFDTYV